MYLSIGGRNVSGLAKSISTSGSRSECARTLKTEIVQSPADRNLPVTPISTGDQVSFSADGQSFVGVVTDISGSTASSTVSVTAKDLGIYVKRNKITHKIKKSTPEAAAAELCGLYGMPAGYFAATGYEYSRTFMGVPLYDAIMAGYILAAQKTGKKYYLSMEGTAVCVRERGQQIAAVISEGRNLIEATYGESIDSVINQVDIYDKSGKLVQSVTGDTTFGVMRETIIQSSKKDGSMEQAQEMIRSNGKKRTGTVKNLGDAGCLAGRAVMIQESFTGLWGLFFIDADSHNWQNGLYTNGLTLAWEDTMDTKAAGEALKGRR